MVDRGFWIGRSVCASSSQFSFCSQVGSSRASSPGVFAKDSRARPSTTRLRSGCFGEEKGGKFEVETWVAKIVYYILLLFALVLFFNQLQLTVVSEPILTLLNKVFGYVPQLLGAAIADRGGVGGGDRCSEDGLGGDRSIFVSTRNSWVRPDLRRAPSRRLGRRSVMASIGSFSFYSCRSFWARLKLGGLLEPVQAMMDRLLTFPAQRARRRRYSRRRLAHRSHRAAYRHQFACRGRRRQARREKSGWVPP